MHAIYRPYANSVEGAVILSMPSNQQKQQKRASWFGPSMNIWTSAYICKNSMTSSGESPTWVCVKCTHKKKWFVLRLRSWSCSFIFLIKFIKIHANYRCTGPFSDPEIIKNFTKSPSPSEFPPATFLVFWPRRPWAEWWFNGDLWVTMLLYKENYGKLVCRVVLDCLMPQSAAF